MSNTNTAFSDDWTTECPTRLECPLSMDELVNGVDITDELETLAALADATPRTLDILFSL